MTDTERPPLVVNMTRDELLAEYAVWQVRHAQSREWGAEYSPGLCLVRMAFIAGVARKRGIDLNTPIDSERNAS